MKSTSKRWTRSLVLLLPAALVIGLALALALGMLRAALPPAPGYNDQLALDFDSTIWKAAPSTTELPAVPARQRMVDDLLRKHPLVGLTKSEVEALIGPADDTPYFRRFDMVYYLGDERSSFAVDSEWLVIKLDGAGRVSRAKLVTD